MKEWVAHLLVGLYPRRWKKRYGAEFEALLQTGPGNLRTMADVLWSACREHVLFISGDNMDEPALSFETIRRQPSAFLPLAMSLSALALVVGHIAAFGVQREADEGAIAHIWQLLMAGQTAILAYFLVQWLPRAPKPALCVLGLQTGAALASMAPVLFFNL